MMIEFTEAEYILLKLSAGISLDDLTDYEIALLKASYGQDWKSKLGYKDD